MKNLNALKLYSSILLLYFQSIVLKYYLNVIRKLSKNKSLCTNSKIVNQ